MIFGHVEGRFGRRPSFPLVGDRDSRWPRKGRQSVTEPQCQLSTRSLRSGGEASLCAAATDWVTIKSRGQENLGNTTTKSAKQGGRGNVPTANTLRYAGTRYKHWMLYDKTENNMGIKTHIARLVNNSNALFCVRIGCSFPSPAIIY